MKNLRIFLVAALAFLPLNEAVAAVVQIQAKDSGGLARSFNVTTNSDITGNLDWNNVICDQAAGTTCATVTGANALKVDGSAAGISTWATGTLGAMANYGTSPGAVLVPGVNAFVTNSNANGSNTAANSSPVVLASNQTAADPCMFQAKSQKNINTASGTTQLVAASGSTKVYVCSFAIVSPSAVSVSLSEGTGATCNTANQAGVMGVAVNGTAANGMPLSANGGLTYGNGGNTVAFTATAANALCLFQSGTAQLAGNITYVQQ